MSPLNTPILKAKYLECFGARASNTATTLRETVKDLADRGISRRTLVAWAVQAGYTKAYVSSLLSRIFCALGLRDRRVGAGRKPSADALELLAYAQSKYAGQALKVLRASLRAGKAQPAFNSESFTMQSSRASGLIVVPQLGDVENNCGTAIKWKTPANGAPQFSTASL